MDIKKMPSVVTISTLDDGIDWARVQVAPEWLIRFLINRPELLTSDTYEWGQPNMRTLGSVVRMFSSPEGSDEDSCAMLNFLQFAVGAELATEVMRAKEVNDRIEYITQFTADNLHTEAIMIGLGLLSDESNAAEIKSLDERAYYIMRKQEEVGYLPEDFIGKRREIYVRMMEVARAQLTPDQFEAFRNAY